MIYVLSQLINGPGGPIPQSARERSGCLLPRATGHDGMSGNVFIMHYIKVHDGLNGNLLHPTFHFLDSTSGDLNI